MSHSKSLSPIIFFGGVDKRKFLLDKRGLTMDKRNQYRKLKNFLVGVPSSHQKNLSPIIFFGGVDKRKFLLDKRGLTMDKRLEKKKFKNSLLGVPTSHSLQCSFSVVSLQQKCSEFPIILQKIQSILTVFQ